MELANGIHLAYCTNIHRGESWEETFRTLNRYTLAVRNRVCPGGAYAIGLRLGAAAARELSDPATLSGFRKWLEKNNCYVFTINGFPYGDFHGTRVKEQVYLPDWSSRDRLDYTKRLFDLLCDILPEGLAGSVSTLPGSFKRFVTDNDRVSAMEQNLAKAVEYIDELSEKMGHDLHLGLEPEPLGYFETSEETVDFFDRLLDSYPGERERVLRRLGVNYDTCHLAVEYERAGESLARFQQNRIRLSKVHLSSALRLADFSASALQRLWGFCDEVYLHQVVAVDKAGRFHRYEDLDLALEARERGKDGAEEWRIHFHIPLHALPLPPLQPTTDHIQDTLDFFKVEPDLCHHFEMETYTWEVLPEDLANSDVVDQLVREYQWTLAEFSARGLAGGAKREEGRGKRDKRC